MQENGILLYYHPFILTRPIVIVPSSEANNPARIALFSAPDHPSPGTHIIIRFVVSLARRSCILLQLQPIYILRGLLFTWILLELAVWICLFQLFEW